MTSPFKSPWMYLPETDEYTLMKQCKKRSGPEVDRTSPSISSDGILKAQVCTKTSEDKISVNVSNGIVNLHPSTMELCCMNYGSAILISTASSANRQSQIASFQVRPSVLVPPGRISMSSDVMSGLKIEKEDYIHVGCVRAHVQVAEAICLCCKDTNMSLGNFMEEYVSQVLQKRYFVQDQLVTIEYLGKKCQFTIHFDVDLSKIDWEVSDNSVIDNYCSKLEDISLKDYSAENKPSNFCSVQVYQIVAETKLRIIKNHLSPLELLSHIGETVSYNDLGGLVDQINKLKNHVELHLNQPKVFIESGVTPSTGIILHGPSGTGKTMLLKSCCNSVNCPTVSIDIAKLLCNNEGNMEAELLKYFNSAMKSAPTLVVIDNVDMICSKKDSKRLDLVLCKILDKISVHNKATHNYVVLLTATNNLSSINQMLRQTERLEYEIEIPIPSSPGRYEIFQKKLQSYKHCLGTVDILTLAEKAHGYVGSDIAAVCKEAGRIAIDRCVSRSSPLSKLSIELPDLEKALKRVPPSAIRELIVEVPKVLWADIGGNSEVKKMLEQTIEWPLKHPDKLERLNIKAPNGVLLYGPPGCSKTLTAKALATESGLNFISIKGPELFSKYVGDSEESIRRIFAKARAASPSIIFIDELDALAGERSGKSGTTSDMTTRVVATLLTELDGVQARQDVIIVAATNRPDKIDKALLRPGRIDRMIYVSLPDEDTRRDILTIQFRRTPVSADLDMNWLVNETNQYSGAEICAVCQEAGLAALGKEMNASELARSDFEFALSRVHPQTTKEVVELFERFSRTSSADNIKY